MYEAITLHVILLDCCYFQGVNIWLSELLHSAPISHVHLLYQSEI